MSRLLISGGAGFLGSHLCDHYLKRDYEVVCVDNLLTGSVANVAHLRDNPKFMFLPVRAEDVRAETLPAPHKPFTLVLHFASPASPEHYLKYPIETLSVGAEGTRRMLDVALANKAVFLVASTSEVYGDPQQHPQQETYWGHVNPVGPRSCYDEAKRYAEALTMAYRRKHNLNTRILRIFNTYGPRMGAGDGRVIPNFITQALAGESLTIYGSGDQTRSFCYYQDLIEGIAKLVQWGDETPTNLGDPNEYTVLQLAKEIISLTGSDSVIKHLAAVQDDPQRRRPDIAKARKQLRWEPKVSLRDGLSQTIEWFRSQAHPQVSVTS